MNFNLKNKYKLKLSHYVNNKLLHKVGKKWVVISLTTVLLMMGGTAITTHADSNTIKTNNNKAILVTNKAKELHQTLLSNASHQTMRLGSKRSVKSKFVRGLYKRTNNKRALNKSGFGKVSKNTVRNYYGPNDKRARIPRNLKLLNNLNWLKDSKSQIKKNPKHIKVYTFNHHKWFIKVLHNNKNRRKLIRKHYNKKKRITHKKGSRRFKSHHYRHSQRKRFSSHTYYLLNTESDSNPALSNRGMRKLQNNDLSNFSDDFSYIINDDNPTVNIISRKSLAGINFDKIEGNGDFGKINNWVFSDELSHRNKGHYYGNPVNTFKRALENQFDSKHFTPDEQSRINELRQKFNYLIKNDDGSSNKPTSKFRQNEINWLNFYRTDLYNVQPVSESVDCDNVAQKGANTRQDPEDLSSGVSDPYNAATGLFTDEDDADGNDESGHRNTVLNPGASQVGVGQNNDINTLYFNSSSLEVDNIAFPNEGVFPLSDAKNALDGSCWSYEFKVPQYTSNTDYVPSVSVYDNTANQNVRVSDINPVPSEIFYHVDANALKDGHQYTVSISGLPTGNATYSFKLFRLNLLS